MRLAPFPAVSERDHKAGRSYQALWSRWRNLRKTPLLVRAQMAAGHLPSLDGGLHLDGVLTSAVLNSRLVGATVGYRGQVAVPLPLALAWASPEGWPLWAATDLRAQQSFPAEIYIHKRHPSDRAPLSSQVAANASAGRYKDVRMPLRTDVAPVLEGWCLGDRDAVAGLLADVTHVGRKGSIGQGLVLGWSVEPAEVDLAWIMERRSVPIDYIASQNESVEATRITPRASWTPPYWEVPRHRPCRRAMWTV